MKYSTDDIVDRMEVPKGTTPTKAKKIIKAYYRMANDKLESLDYPSIYFRRIGFLHLDYAKLIRDCKDMQNALFKLSVCHSKTSENAIYAKLACKYKLKNRLELITKYNKLYDSYQIMLAKISKRSRSATSKLLKHATNNKYIPGIRKLVKKIRVDRELSEKQEKVLQ